MQCGKRCLKYYINHPICSFKNLFENITDDNAVVDAIFSQTMTSKNIDLHVLNKKTYGQLVNLYDLQEDKLYPEIVRIMENHDLWERR